METEIITYEDCEEESLNIIMKRFWGGSKLGTLYSLFKKDTSSGICVSEKELTFVIYKKLKVDYDEMQSKDTLYDGHIKYIEIIKPLIDYLKKKWGFK